MITQSRLKKLVRYDPATGVFTRISGKRRGKRAGCIQGGIPNRERPSRRLPYWVIRVEGTRKPASWWAHLYMTGQWPKEEMDHEDRDTLNDRWANLVPANRFENEKNKGAYRNNQTGLKGVHFDVRTGKFYAAIQRNWQRVKLGSFTSAQAASAAYQAADRAAA